MRHNTVDDDFENEPQKPEFLPLWFKVILNLIFSVLFVLAVFPIFWAIYIEQESVKHVKDLGLVTIGLWSAIALLFVNAPWRRIGMVFSKIGPIEFREALETQNKEFAKALAPLESKVEELEKIIIELEKGKSQDILANPQSPTLEERLSRSLEEDDELSRKLMEFFDTYNGQFFNATRIRNWGGRITGFETFSQSSPQEISQHLRSLLATGKVDTMISQKGTTLYGRK